MPGRFTVNLLGNALEFTSAGWIGLDVAASPDRSGCDLELTVVDTDIGIPQDVQPQLFTRFMQADSSTSRPGAIGLGRTCRGRPTTRGCWWPRTTPPTRWWPSECCTSWDTRT